MAGSLSNRNNLSSKSCCQQFPFTPYWTQLIPQSLQTFKALRMHVAEVVLDSMPDILPLAQSNSRRRRRKKKRIATNMKRLLVAFRHVHYASSMRLCFTQFQGIFLRWKKKKKKKTTTTKRNYNPYNFKMNVSGGRCVIIICPVRPGERKKCLYQPSTRGSYV